MNDLVSGLIYAPLGAIIITVIQGFNTKRKNKISGDLDAVNGAKVVQGMALEMLQPLQAQIDKLQGKIQCLEHKIVILNGDLQKAHEDRAIAEEDRARAEDERDHYKLQLLGR